MEWDGMGIETNTEMVAGIKGQNGQQGSAVSLGSGPRVVEEHNHNTPGSKVIVTGSLH